MALAERLATAQPKPRGLPCPISLILQQLPPEDAAALQTALDIPLGQSGRLGARVIADELAHEGYEIHYAGVEKHRRGSCRCFRGNGR